MSLTMNEKVTRKTRDLEAMVPASSEDERWQRAQLPAPRLGCWMRCTVWRSWPTASMVGSVHEQWLEHLCLLFQLLLGPSLEELPWRVLTISQERLTRSWHPSRCRCRGLAPLFPAGRGWFGGVLDGDGWTSWLPCCCAVLKARERAAPWLPNWRTGRWATGVSAPLHGFSPCFHTIAALAGYLLSHKHVAQA